MYVIKRNGRREPVMFDKITSRIKKLCYGLDDRFVDPLIVSQKVCAWRMEPALARARPRAPSLTARVFAPQVCAGVYKGVTTTELDELVSKRGSAGDSRAESSAAACRRPAPRLSDVPPARAHAQAAEVAAHLTSEHPDYGLLAARIAVSNLHKNTLKARSVGARPPPLRASP
jgi:hypothetical protein